MKKLFSLFFLVLFSSLLLSSCSNDDDDKPAPTPTPAPAPGIIKAMVTPAGSAKNMLVTQGSTTQEATPDANGVFQINNLAAGDYSVTFTPITGYTAPAAQNATVTAGNTTDLGTITLTSPTSQLLGTMSATVNGAPWLSMIQAAQVSGDTLTITGTSADLTGGTSGSGDVIVLMLQHVTGPGTFSNQTGAMGIYTTVSLTGGGSTPPTWITAILGSCTVTITKFDKTAKKITGTFSFKANPMPGTSSSGTKTITNGAFTNLMYQ